MRSARWRAACAFLGAFLLGLALGRFATPEKVVERTVEVRAERSSETDQVRTADAETVALARTVIVETTTRPDGTVTVIETEREEAVREVAHEVEVVRTVEVEKLVYVDRERTEERPLAQWRVGAELGLDLGGRRLPIPGIPPGVPAVAGVVAERRVAGPVWAGAWASTGYAAGVRLSVEF